MKFNFDLNKHLDDLPSVFDASMDRQFGEFIPIRGDVLNLGAGEKSFPWAVPIQKPEWDAEQQPLPFGDAAFNAAVAFHFFEHISPKRLPYVLSECSRVLKHNGTLTVVVPHRLGGMAFQDIDHKTFFTENTWRILLDNAYYATTVGDLKIDLKVNVNMIFGETERTLALVTQFVKG